MRAAQGEIKLNHDHRVFSDRTPLYLVYGHRSSCWHDGAVDSTRAVWVDRRANRKQLEFAHAPASS